MEHNCLFFQIFPFGIHTKINLSYYTIKIKFIIEERLVLVNCTFDKNRTFITYSKIILF